MAYRDDSADGLEAPTGEGVLRLECGPRSVKLTIDNRTLHVVDQHVTILEQRRKKVRRESFKIGRLLVARDVPHEDLGVWIELPGGMRRIFGVEPVSLLEHGGLAALSALDRLAQRLRVALAGHAGNIRRAIEIGRGLDKVLLTDRGDHYAIYARRLFRDRARLALEIYADGRIVIPTGRSRPAKNKHRAKDKDKDKNKSENTGAKAPRDVEVTKSATEVTVRSRFGVTVFGDYIRFAAPDGTDLARVSIPWIAPEDRHELARRIGQLVDTSTPAVTIAFPYDKLASTE